MKEDWFEKTIGALLLVAAGVSLTKEGIAYLVLFGGLYLLGYNIITTDTISKRKKKGDKKK